MKKREAREHGLNPCVAVYPEKRHDWNREQEGGDSQQRLVGRRDLHGIEIAFDMIHLNLRRTTRAVGFDQESSV